jgi:prolyl-tRNA synthetase
VHVGESTNLIELAESTRRYHPLQIDLYLVAPSTMSHQVVDQPAGGPEDAKVGDVAAALNDAQIEPEKVSKNAAKKAAKQEKLAADKANKSAGNTVKEAGKAEASKAKKKPAAKKVEGAALIGIDVAKEDDFPNWYQQVLSKGDMLDYYDVSGCYILKVDDEAALS